jgi:dodecin
MERRLLDVSQRAVAADLPPVKRRVVERLRLPSASERGSRMRHLVPHREPPRPILRRRRTDPKNAAFTEYSRRSTTMMLVSGPPELIHVVQERSMSNVVKVIEVIAESEKSWEDAVQTAVIVASETLHGIKSVYVDNFTAKVENDRIVEYRVDAKISFLLESPTGNKKRAETATSAGASI